MLGKGVKLKERDLVKQPLDESELKSIVGEGDPREFLNSRNSIYRKNKLGTGKFNREDLIRLMAQNPNLIKRPIIVKRGKNVVVGFDVVKIKQLV